MRAIRLAALLLALALLLCGCRYAVVESDDVAIIEPRATAIADSPAQ